MLFSFTCTPPERQLTRELAMGLVENLILPLCVGIPSLVTTRPLRSFCLCVRSPGFGISVIHIKVCNRSSDLKKNISSSIVSRILPATPLRRFLQLLPLGSLFPCLNFAFPMSRPWFGSGAFVFELLIYVPILFAFLAAFLRPEHLSAVVFVRLVSSFGCVLLSCSVVSISCLVNPLCICSAKFSTLSFYGCPQDLLFAVAS